MLEALHIRNYILIDTLDVTFPEGLVIVTGQTGAGKSILLGALSLLTGTKADASVISGDADNCVVEGEFTIDDGVVMSVLEENDVELDGGHLSVRRVVHRSGRSRSFINDCPVQVSVLSSIASRLIDIHSQHQSLMLSDRQFQLSTLDLFASDGALLERSRKVWRRLQELKSELAETESRLSRLEREREYNQSRYNRLESAALRDGELEELEIEQSRLSNAEDIKDALSSTEDILSPADDGRQGIVSMLKESSRLLSKVSSFVPGVPRLLERIDASRIELDDLISEISDINARMDVSPQRLEAVEERMALIYDLMQKHGCSSVAELIAERDSLSEVLFDSTALSEKCDFLKESISSTQQEMDALCSEIHEARVYAAPGLARRLQSELRYLELDRSVFDIAVDKSLQGPEGADAVTFLFSSTGQNPVDVAKCASGGEISRIMLCLKALLSEFKSMPTMMFDEIDTGVSGSVADKMGSMICKLGDRMQVFAITHLPQVAAKGRAHFVVSKEEGDSVRSTIKKLSPEERVLEIARMLSGSVITPEAMANARSLLG